MVAFKILLRNRRGDPISVERFRHEAYLASRLRHPNAVVIYDFGQSGDGLLYIAMELLAGENLKQRIRQSARCPSRRPSRFSVEPATHQPSSSHGLDSSGLKAGQHFHHQG